MSFLSYCSGYHTNLAVKYRVQMCDIMNQQFKSNSTMQQFLMDDEILFSNRNPNAIRLNLYRWLSLNSRSNIILGNDICLSFSIQEQGNPCLNPIEDHGTEWSGDWITIAEIRIPKQQFLYKTQLRFCEKLIFNPWNGLKHHEPLSSIGKARRYSYQVATNERIKENFIYYEPNGSEIFHGQLWRQKQQNHYFYRNVSGFNLPVHMGSRLPRQELFSWSKTFYIIYNILHSMSSSWFASFYSQAQLKLQFQSLLNYTEVFRHDPGINLLFKLFLPKYVQPPEYILDNWSSDEYFASQYIRGSNPMLIQTVEPSSWPIKDLILTDRKIRQINLMLKTTTIVELLYSKRLFLIDYYMLQYINTVSSAALYAPLLILYTNSTGDLLPLFIQLDRPNHNSSKCCEIYLPTDPYYVWLFAKMHVTSSDSIWETTISHLLHTHLVLEPIVISTLNNLHDNQHPLYKFLSPFLHGTLAINEFGRRTLLSEHHSIYESVFASGLQGALQLMEHYFNKNIFTYKNSTCFIYNLRSRGFTISSNSTSTSIPYIRGFLYYEYGLKLWNALYQYVQSTLKHRDFDKILLDEQFQNWLTEINEHLSGFGSSNESELIELLTCILFTSSVQHSSVSSLYYDTYSFIPNRPTFLTSYMPPKEQWHLLNEHFIVSALPSYIRTIEIIRLCKFVGSDQQTIKYDLCSSVCDNVTSQFNYNLDVPSERKHYFQIEHTQFLNELRKLEKEFRQNNYVNNYYYPYLYPSRISQSTDT